MKQHITARYILIVAILALTGIAAPTYCCTSAVVSGKVTASGRPILWKHRDTSNADNKVEYIQGNNGKLSYVGLFNAKDLKCRQAWIGMNEAGFAIMNTASYNLHPKGRSKRNMDREGYLMAEALQSCRTVDDFVRYMDGLPRPLGVEANFGVIDALGHGAYFETNINGYKKYDVDDAPYGVLIRTNYSHSGRQGEGSGYVREANAIHLIIPYAQSHSLTPEFLTENVSRSFYRDVQHTDYLKGVERIIPDQDFIPRYTSVATVAIEGMIPQATIPDKADVARQYIMWTGLGYPPCAEIVPVWCTPDGVDTTLRGIGPNGHSEMSDRIRCRHKEVFGSAPGRYINLEKLSNQDGTGYLQVLVPQNMKIYEKFRNR